MKIVKGIQKKVMRTLVYGEPGVGKTTFGSLFPAPIFLGNELPDHIDVPKLKDVDMTLEGLISAAKFLQEQTEYKTIVVDTVTGIQNALVEAMLAKVNKGKEDKDKRSVHTYGRGFGEGQQNTLSKITYFVDELSKCPVDDIIFITHTRIREVKLLGGDKMDKMVPALESKIIEWFYQAMDNMFYIDIMRDSVKTSKGVTNTNKRILYTEGTELFTAKNRANMVPAYAYTGPKAVDGIRGEMYKLFSDAQKS